MRQYKKTGFCITPITNHPRVVNVFVITLFMLSLASAAYAGDWVADWFSSKTSTSPGYMSGQKRGYATGGNFKARWPSTTSTNIISTTMPSIKAGCGGIDFNMGSLSFLNSDQLVEKLQRILQNSAGVAFDMALQTLCPKCSEIMKSLEALSSSLNGLAMDDCAAAKMIVGKSLGDKNAGFLHDAVKESSIMGGINEGAGDFSSAIKGWTTSVNDASGYLRDKKGLAANQSPLIMGCDATVKNFFPDNTDEYPYSLIDKVMSDMSLDADYGKLIRGLVGDILVKSDYLVAAVPPCSENVEQNISDLLIETVWLSPAPTKTNPVPKCDPSATPGLEVLSKDVSTKVDKVINAMKNKTAIDDPTLIWLNSAPLSVHYALRMAVASGQDGYVKADLVRMIATQYGMKAITDVYRRMSEVALLVARVRVAPSNGETCQIGGLLESLDSAYVQFDAGARYGHAVMKESADAEVKDYISASDYVRSLYEVESRIEAATARAFSPSVGARIRSKMKLLR